MSVSDEVGVGHLYDGTDFTAPPEPMVTVDELRVVRDELLRSSDFTQLDDAPGSKKTEWATYRQELRDLPSSYVPIANPVYPTKP